MDNEKYINVYLWLNPLLELLGKQVIEMQRGTITANSAEKMEYQRKINTHFALNMKVPIAKERARKSKFSA